MPDNAPITRSLKLLYLPNEGDSKGIAYRQNGPRIVFERLCQEGVLSDYQAVSFLSEYQRTHDAQAVQTKILSCATATRPDIIFWQHIGDFPVDRDFLEKLRSVSGGALLAYHDDDAFGRIFKRVTPQMRTIMSSSDITFLSGKGGLAQLMRKNGAKDVRYLPSHYDPRRFDKPWDFTERRTYKLAMIANRCMTRIPGIYLPGGRNRVRLVKRLTDNFGADFALYGRGWDGLVSARGPLPYDRQEAAIRNSWVSVNWDHFDGYDYYFSDRLPISLISGVPHVTTYHTGFEEVFAGCQNLYTARTVDEAAEKVEWVLSRPQKQLIEDGRAAQEWTRNNLSADVVFRNAIQICADKIAR